MHPLQTAAQAKEITRIQQELRAVGVSSLGLRRFASKFLPVVLHPGEHIGGAVYGRYAADGGWLRWAEGMLVATEYRIIFLDRKPGFENINEVSYRVVSGIRKSYAWPFAALTLYTRLGNYTIRYAREQCIDIFIRYVEKRILETTNPSQPHMPNRFTMPPF